MPKVSIPGFIHLDPNSDLDGKPQYTFWRWDDMSQSGYVLVGPHTMEFEVPDDFDPTAGRIAALEKQREKITKEFRDSVAAINEQISRLQCIEFTPPAPTFAPADEVFF